MRRAWHALAAYTAIAIIATWPLARGLGRDVAWDLGDPLLVMWALAWDCEQLLAILRGDLSRAATFFDANIFHPASTTLAYSEHFIPQALQVLPVYAVTRNPILCYNLLFLSTFVLSGLGTYLLVHELTRNRPAAFVAGLLFAFAPYRFPQSSHLHVLSSQWMPFALYGFVQYVRAIGDPARAITLTRDWRPLAGASAALAVQSLSCGYYLLYFAPFAAGFVVWELVARGVWRNWRVWTQLAVAAAAVAIVTVPFLLPYAAIRGELSAQRYPGEVVRFSADVYSYLTAFAGQPVWGDVAQAFPKPEGDLFPGAAAVLLAAIGVIAGVPRRVEAAVVTRRSRVVATVLLVAAAAHLIATMAVLLSRRITLDLWVVDVRMSDATQLLTRAAVLLAIALALSPGMRARARMLVAGRGFFVVALVAALWLSLGPSPRSMGRPVDIAAPYSVLYEHVPGFDGVRVPARYAMIVTLMLSVLGGYGAVAIARLPRGAVALAVIGVAALAESLAIPFVVNGGGGAPNGLNAAEPRVYRPARAPAVYHAVSKTPQDAVLVELPAGAPDYDLRAMYYSTVHWRRLVNGYSGFFPPHYNPLVVALGEVARHPGIALEALRAAGATHAIVHEAAYLDDQGPQITAALRANGALEVFRDGGDVLLRLP